MLTNTEKALIQILLKMGLDQNEMVWTMLKLKEKETDEKRRSHTAEDCFFGSCAFRPATLQCMAVPH